ncbi:SDR family NAD(P)-dependent oxidoreductase [Agrobacterium pusense]|uniref:SDR family NAD(P)-dependent oxidoreductase n=1 Tax=Agrobacterium pusense TaxID=648995 RepID=UPI002F3FDA00
MQELAGKNALVTGGSRGIGAAIARALSGKGANVAITYERSAESAAQLVRAIQAAGCIAAIKVRFSVNQDETCAGV